mmetsp:Transcript_103538/g.278169  ORF Transcript_103538/g.278169 Transcript_103538/m.278169 type:complete len:126 (+) Transcript_103538:672-1049(+)
MLPQGCDEIFLVTSDFHMPRSAYLFEAVFASKDMIVSVVQHPARSGCQVVQATSEQQSGKSSVSTINGQSAVVRARNEAHFIKHEVVQIGLREHILGTQIPPLPHWSLELAESQIQECLLQLRAQ